MFLRRTSSRMSRASSGEDARARESVVVMDASAGAGRVGAIHDALAPAWRACGWMREVVRHTAVEGARR